MASCSTPGRRLGREDSELMFPAGRCPRLREALLGWEGGQGPGQQTFHQKPWVGLTLRTREAGVCPGTRKRIIVGAAAGTVHPQGRHRSGPDSAWLKGPSEGPPPSPMHPSEDGLDMNPKPTASWGERPAEASCLAFWPHLPRAGGSLTRVIPPGLMPPVHLGWGEQDLCAWHERPQYCQKDLPGDGNCRLGAPWPLGQKSAPGLVQLACWCLLTTLGLPWAPCLSRYLPD